MRTAVIIAVLLLSACGSEPERVEGREPGDCDDGADNDGDGRFDCDDTGCSGAPACQDRASAPTSPEVAAPDRAATEVEAAPAAVSPMDLPPIVVDVAGPSASAREAYRRMLTAYRDGDAPAYFAGYADTMRCFHGRRDYARSGVESSAARLDALRRNAVIRRSGEGSPHRARYLELRVVSADEDEVVLVDFGWTGTGVADPETVFHQKRVTLARDGTAWRVVVEGPAHRSVCGLPALREEPPPLWTQMRVWFTDAVNACVGPEGATLEDGYPGLFGSIGCDPTTTAPVPSAVCAGVAEADRAGCIAHARAELASFTHVR